MKLKQLQNEACAKYDEIDYSAPDRNKRIKDFIAQEIKNAIAAAFKETSVEERNVYSEWKCNISTKLYTKEMVEAFDRLSCEIIGFNQALSDTKIKQNEFLNS